MKGGWLFKKKDYRAQTKERTKQNKKQEFIYIA
jgi:hypothetical protein